MTGKEKRQKFYAAVKTELTENRNTFLVYSGLRILVIFVMIMQIFNRNYENVFLCMLTLGLMIVPSVLQATFKVEFPSVLEIIILCFIFAAEILGEISSFYIHFPYWDTILHTLNGFICAAIGVSMVELLNGNKRIKFELSPFFTAVVSFCFSMTIGVLWEFFEYGMDVFLLLDMQKDTVINAISSTYLDPARQNNRILITSIQEVMINGEPLGVGGYLDIGLKDTMADMLVNFIGAVAFAVLAYVFGKRGNKKLITNLVPFLQKDNKYAPLKESEDALEAGKEEAMRLKNILFVVNDIEVSKKFYQELFGLTVVTDFGRNVILSEGLVLQERKLWEEFLNRNVVYGNHDAELYFEENDIDGFLKKLDNSSFQIEYIDRCIEHEWGQRVIRLYDPDRHVIEIGESLEHVARRNE